MSLLTRFAGKGLPTREQLESAGPVQSVPDPAREHKKALAVRDCLNQTIHDETGLAALSQNEAFLRLVAEGRQKALLALVQSKDLTREGPALQANVRVFSEMEGKVQTAVENLNQHRQQLATLQAQLEKSGETT